MKLLFDALTSHCIRVLRHDQYVDSLGIIVPSEFHKAWAFSPYEDFGFSADEMQQISAKLTELNQAKPPG